MMRMPLLDGLILLSLMAGAAFPQGCGGAVREVCIIDPGIGSPAVAQARTVPPIPPAQSHPDTHAVVEKEGTTIESPRNIPDHSTIHQLAGRLGKGNWADYEYAFNTLVRSGKAAVPELLNVIKNGDTQPRSQAAMVLLHIGRDAKDAIPALVEMLKDEKEYMRNCAANALGYIGGDGTLAVTALTDALSDEAWRVRFLAANALFVIGRSSPETDAALVRATDDKHEWVRRAAARSLAKIRSSGSSQSAESQETSNKPDAGDGK